MIIRPIIYPFYLGWYFWYFKTRSIANQDDKDLVPVKKKPKGILGDLNTIDLESAEGRQLLDAKSAFENIVTDVSRTMTNPN